MSRPTPKWLRIEHRERGPDDWQVRLHVRQGISTYFTLLVIGLLLSTVAAWGFSGGERKMLTWAVVYGAVLLVAVWGLLSKIVISIDGDRIHISKGPLGWWRARRFETREVVDCFDERGSLTLKLRDGSSVRTVALESDRMDRVVRMVSRRIRIPQARKPPARRKALPPFDPESIMSKIRETPKSFSVRLLTGKNNPRLKISFPASVSVMHRAVSRFFGMISILLLLLGFYFHQQFLPDVEFGTFMMAMLIGLLGVPIALIVLRMMINRVHLLVAPSHLTVRHFPIPWPPGRSLDVEKISGFHIEDELEGASSRDLSNITFFAVLTTGKTVRLFFGGYAAEQIEWLKRILESKV